MTLEQKILNRIKEKQVKPTSRVYFAIRDMGKLALFALSLLALGITAAMVIFFTGSTDSEVLEKLEISTAQKIFSSVPAFWILATLLISGLAYVNLRVTRRGYKMSLKQFGIMAVVVAVGLGGLLYMTNVSEYVDQVASKNIPLYKNVVPINTDTWFDPNHGLISGTVISRDSNESFTMRDRDTELWDITSKNLKMPEGYQFHVGDRVKMIGKKTGLYTFEAREIYPWID